MRARAALTAGWTAAALIVLLGGCSLTPALLEDRSEDASQNYADDYQKVYLRLIDTATRCLTRHNINAARMAVESDIHQEAGFGVVRFVVHGILNSNYFVSAKIEKMGQGSRVSVKTNNAMISNRLDKMVFRWAGGDQECQQQ